MTILRYDDYETSSGRATYDADVVIVGTGAGGAAAGAELAEAGVDVAFVEEGSYHPTSSFNPYATESLPRLFRDAAATMIFGRPPIPYLEGRCVGGSTTVNGGMTWRTPDRILADWERLCGPELGAAAMEPLFERVEKSVNASRQIEASLGEDSRLMEEGARRLGWDYLHTVRSQRNCVGSNNCVLGCPTGAKQSTLVSYIPRAIAAGARCLTEVRVESLLIEGGRCVGVRGASLCPRDRRTRRPVTVRAKAVIVACGATQTPALLLGHKLGRTSGQLGRNFLCHPNAKVLAVYPFDVKAWQGVNQGGQVREFVADGYLFAENFIPPAELAASMPTHGLRAWEIMKDYNRMALTGVLVEDSHAGRVTRGLGGQPVPQYSITPLDHARFLEGIRKLAMLHFEMGAERVYLPFSNLHEVTSADELQKIGATQRSRSTLELFTVHLMGTARMGASASDSVVDLDGQLWDLPGCYVADASLFPTAIGVNPQITIMALATRVAQRLSERVLSKAA
ncbi:MAG: GMC family oxidoreductase N-terminal domain-containing protein [Myxococcales bacterium]|nr:GMC family oxidoreductase N-terminal domain-containing protein [Myxococcales bacterium]